jgi:uncharacterized protein YodC (DUF2158 family)
MEIPPLETVQSSYLAAYAYAPETSTFFARFHSGKVWAYDRVPPAVYAELLKSPSKGSYFWIHIRPYPGRQVGMKETRYAINDRVRLKSGGPVMVIVGIEEGGRALCEWLNEQGRKQREPFAFLTLETAA